MSDAARTIAQRLAETVDLDVAWALDFRVVDQRVCVGDLGAVGDAEVVANARAEGVWSPRKVHRSDFELGDGPGPYLHAARLVVHREIEVVGLVGGARTTRFGPEERAALREVAPELAEALRTWVRRLDETRPARAMALCGCDGEVRLVSDGDQAWFDPERRVALREATVGGFEPLVTGGCAGRPSPVSGEAGDAVLWSFQPASAPRRDAGELLSPRQLEVAQYAAAGATTEEIGRAMGISPYTARQHLKAVYGQLGTRNRVELAAVLEGRPR